MHNVPVPSPPSRHVEHLSPHAHDQPPPSQFADRVRPPALEPILPVRPAVEPKQARERDRRYRRLLVLADVLATATAMAVCVPLLGKSDMLTPLVVAAVPLIVLLAKVLGLYDRDELLLRKTTLDEVPKLFHVATLTALLLSLSSARLIEGQMGHRQTLGFWISLSLLLPVARWWARALARRSAPLENCLLIGEPEACSRVLAKIEDGHGVHAHVVAMIDIEEAEDLEDAAAVLAMVAEERDVHRVVIAPPTTDRGEVLNLIRVSKNLGLKVSVVPRMLEVIGSSVEFDDLEGVNLLGVRRFGLTRSSRFIKRGMDVVGSALALVILAPLLAVIAVAIKLDSRGPVLFRQDRVGRDGRVFEMLKFRTMVQDAEGLKPGLHSRNEADGLFKIVDDPRVLRVGRLLRRLSLDELPQLINVLLGEMSLVGPRPLILDDDRRVEGWFRRRLQLTPGMTGRWQVLGSARIPLHEMVKLDYLYLANWSLWGDVKILIRTLQFVLGRRGL